MPENDQSFRDLLNEAPAAADTVTVTGVLSRAKEPGKFVLNAPNGQAMTLDVAAVKSHTVIARSIGQTIVQVEVDEASLPEAVKNASSATTGALGTAFTNPDIDFITIAGFDRPHTLPYLDWHPTIAYFDQPGTPPIADLRGPGTGVVDTLVETIPDPGVINQVQAATAMAPFALATPHHVGAATMAAIQPFGGWGLGPFTVWQDAHTGFVDRPKPPPQDGTFPGHPPSNDF